jgi:stage III sporulation protein AA
MNLQFLGDKILKGISCIKDKEKLYEIRIREGFGVKVVYDFNKYFLSENGLTDYSNNSIKITSEQLKKIIEILTDKSYYAFNDKIKQGYLVSEDGVRIGISGECVFDKEIVTIKNVTSLNVRIPHDIKGCCNFCYPYIVNDEKTYNTLVVSPPFCGKTTILKDISKRLNFETNFNILLIDERGEFSNVKGENIDSIKFSDKFYAFSCALRSLSPEIVITDELCAKKDWELAKTVINSGVKIIASCHAENIEQLKNKDFYISGIFDRIIFLHSDKKFVGKVKNVYGEFEKLIV